jgi:hypothetical protein
MRNTFLKGSSPREELEFAKTAIALGQPVDTLALMEALEWLLNKRNQEMEYWKAEYAEKESECDDLAERCEDLEAQIAGEKE